VLMGDHLVKNREERGRYDLGGVHKLNGIDGASFLLENKSPFGLGLTGSSALYIRKDRPGQLRRHGIRRDDGMYWIADLVIRSHDETFTETWVAIPYGDADPKPTRVMAKVARELTKGDMSLRQIVDRVGGKQEIVRKAIACLVDDGYVTVTKGPRGAHIHHLERAIEGGGT